VRTLLGSFLFSGDSVFKKVDVLSGGEKSRLALVKLLLSPPNLLLMDEPTTHLDMGSIDALVDALKQFEGTLVFISHDVHFIRSLANKVLHVANGVLTPYLGDYAFYLQKTKAESARAALTAGGVGGKAAPKEPKPTKGGAAAATTTAAPAAAPKPAAGGVPIDRDKQKQVKKLQQQVQKIEQQIELAEQTKAALQQQLEDPALWHDAARADEVQKDFASVGSVLTQLTAQWEQAAAQLEQVERG
jgi:ATP-binding cassette subfamily F protein 3